MKRSMFLFILGMFLVSLSASAMSTGELILWVMRDKNITDPKSIFVQKLQSVSPIEVERDLGVFGKLDNGVKSRDTSLGRICVKRGQFLKALVWVDDVTARLFSNKDVTVDGQLRKKQDYIQIQRHVTEKLITAQLNEQNQITKVSLDPVGDAGPMEMIGLGVTKFSLIKIFMALKSEFDLYGPKTIDYFIKKGILTPTTVRNVSEYDRNAEVLHHHVVWTECER